MSLGKNVDQFNFPRSRSDVKVKGHPNYANLCIDNFVVLTLMNYITHFENFET
jgi:hypothetical protein